MKDFTKKNLDNNPNLVNDQGNPKVTPKRNMMELNTVYQFNINPDDQSQHFGEGHRTLMVIKTLKSHLNTLRCAYQLYPEYSVPTEGELNRGLTRLHFHGYIIFTTYAELLHWYEIGQNSLYAFSHICIGPIKDEKYRLKYCKKNKSPMRQFLKIYKEDYPIENWKWVEYHRTDDLDKIRE